VIQRFITRRQAREAGRRPLEQGHDLLRVVLLDLGQERRRAAAAHGRHGVAPV
jgi:hypothetical protein